MPIYNWENNVLGFLREPDRLSVPFNPARPNDPIDGLFGDQKTDNIVATSTVSILTLIPACVHCCASNAAILSRFAANANVYALPS